MNAVRSINCCISEILISTLKWQIIILILQTFIKKKKLPFYFDGINGFDKNYTENDIIKLSLKIF